MRRMMIGTLCLLCITFSCKKEVKTEELVLSAAKQYYDHLAGGRYQEFLAGIADADSLPPAYREQLLTNAKQFLEQQNKAHKGIKEIQTIKAVIDTAHHQAQAFLLLCFSDSIKEEIVVPMTEPDGEWRMN